jgi:hypothetical protein
LALYEKLLMKLMENPSIKNSYIFNSFKISQFTNEMPAHKILCHQQIWHVKLLLNIVYPYFKNIIHIF